MCSSNMRRQARHFFCSALKGDRRRWWRGAVPFGQCRSKKAADTAEKSGGSKPRRKRGLRKGHPRSRVGKTRRSDTSRQPLSKAPSERAFKKVISQIDFWQARYDQFLGRNRSFLEKNVRILNKSPPSVPPQFRNARISTLRLYGFGLTGEELRMREQLESIKDRYESLNARILSAHTAVRPQGRSWSFFIEKEFGVTLFDYCQFSALDELEIMGAKFEKAPPVPTKKKTLVRRPAGSRSKNTAAASAQAVRCTHGRTMLTCPSCAKVSKAPRGSSVFR